MIAWITQIYILIIRGTPMMLQIIFVYFAEIFRSGMESIPKGQKEAAFTLGMTKTQTFFKITLPQIIKRILPTLSNEVISLIKTTSLAQIIGVTEVFALAQKQASFQFSIVPLCVAGVIYLILCAMITLGFHKAEKRLDYYTIT